ncbi:hypothetical protein ACTVLW_12860 [Serratia ureilytica]|uniref:hypothetical protein n=1 Tax=Serratia ureilytica TaxID=300181 RepID=UPI003FA6D1CC
MIGLNEKNLTRQPLFWAALVIPLILFLISGCTVWSKYKLGFNELGYENFIKASKLPLLLLSLSVPLVAIIAHIHRTIQTEKQIEHTQEQIRNTQKQIGLLEEKNKPDSYYAHLKSITEALSLIPSFKIPRAYVNGNTHDILSIKYPHPLYKKIFSKSKIKDGYSTEINSEFMRGIETSYNHINDIFLHFKNSTLDSERMRWLLSLETIIFNLCKELSINFSPEEHLFIISDSASPAKEQDTFFSSEDEIKSTLIGIRNTIIHIYDLLDLDSGIFRASENSGNFVVSYLYSEDNILGDLYPTFRRSKSYNIR